MWISTWAIIIWGKCSISLLIRQIQMETRMNITVHSPECLTFKRQVIAKVGDEGG